MEVWKDIDDSYEVSNYGNVRSKQRISVQPYNGGQRVHKLNGRMLAKQKSADGYLRVKLHNRYVSVSHLVATAFVPNPNGYNVVHHIDHNPENNMAENLCWIERDIHDLVHSQEKAKQVYQYTLGGTLVRVWESTNECGRNGFTQSKISLCCNGLRNQHKGFKWSYTPLV